MKASATWKNEALADLKIGHYKTMVVQGPI